MFSCVNIRDQAAAIVPNPITTNGLPRFKSVDHIDSQSQSYANFTPSELDFADEDAQNHNGDHDERKNGFNLTDREMLDRVLEEGMRLKLKCKQLRFSLLQQDQLLLEERQNFSRKVDDMQITMETTIAELRAKHYLEVTHVRDHRINELQELQEKLLFLEEENAQYRSANNSYEEQLHQLQQDKYELEAEIEKEKQAVVNDLRYTAGYKEGLQFELNEVELLQNELDRERAKYHNLVQSIEDDRNREETLENKQLSSILHDESHSAQEFAATDTLLHLKSNPLIQKDVHLYHCCHICARYQEHLAQTIHNVTELQIACNQKDDEKAYYYEETARLERQIHLLKTEIKDLQSRGLSPQFHLQQTSEREKRLLHELQTAKEQILELNQALEVMLLSKADVEDAVHHVTRDNQRLLSELYDTKKQLLHQQKISASASFETKEEKLPLSRNVGKVVDSRVPKDTLECTGVFHNLHRTQTQPVGEQYPLLMVNVSTKDAALSSSSQLVGSHISPTESNPSHHGAEVQCHASVTTDRSIDTCEPSLSIDVPLPSPPSSAADTPKKHYHHQLPIAVPSARRKQPSTLYPTHATVTSVSSSIELATLSSPPSINKRGTMQTNDLTHKRSDNDHKVTSLHSSREFSPSLFHVPNPKPIPHHRRSASESGTVVTTADYKQVGHSKDSTSANVH